MLNIQAESFSLQSQIAADRDYLHTNPELSGKEENTLRWITQRLDTLNIRWEQVEHGGLVAVLCGHGEGKRLLLRADVDALPVEESPQNIAAVKKTVSAITGISHACGHDAHTAMLLGALQILAAHREEFTGEIVAVFEQGEETSYGVIPLLEYIQGHFDGIDGCFAIHVNADLEEGKLSVQPDYVMCGALGFDVELIGKGGHSSRPDLCNNPIDCFVSIYNDLASVRMRHTDPNHCLTYTMGLLQSGNKVNIIPERLRFAGMARFFREDTCGWPFLNSLKKIITSNAELYDCKVEYNYIMEPVPGVYNDKTCAALANQCLSKDLGQEAVCQAEPWMASESMALYNILYSGLLAFLGIKSESGYGAPHHSPNFDLNSDMLYKGTAAFVSYALAFLDEDFTASPRKPADGTLQRLKKQLM